MDNLARMVLKSHSDLRGKRANWESHWMEVLDHVLPRKRNVFSFRSQPGGEKRNNRIFDSTAIMANQLLGSALQGMLTNPATQWLDLTTGVPELDNDSEVRGYLQKMARKILQVYNNTNFQNQINEVYLDLGSMGTAALRIEADKEKIITFTARPIYEHWIKEDHKGMVDTISREYKLTGRQLKQKFNFEKAAKRLDPEDTLKLQKFDDDPEKQWNLINYIAPRNEFDKNEIPGGARRFKWTSIHVVEDLEISLEVSGFEEFPYAVPRWTKTSHEEYGRSPATQALPDIKMINEQMRTHLRAAQKMVDPPLQMPDEGMMMPIKTSPNGLNYYRAGTGDRIEPLITGGRIDISFEVMQDVRRRIKEAFFVDQLQLAEGPQMTATEVLQRTEEKLRLLGPTLGRLHHELLIPMIERSIDIMARAGELPPDPPEQLKDLRLEINFSSQIARAQKASEADNITRVIGIMAPIVEAQPEIMDNIDGDGMLQFMGNLFNVPQEMFRKPKEVKELRAQRAQAQQQQAQLEQQKLQSEAAKNVGVQVPQQ